jgi:hypothetical protein
MSTEKGAAKRRLSSEGTNKDTNTANLEQQIQQQPQPSQPKNVSPTATSTTTSTTAQATSPPSTRQGEGEMTEHKGNEASASQTTSMGTDESTVTVEARTESGDSPRQVIAVSASKSPAAFFNLARKFLVTNEMCDLSALEGAIVSAVDAAHLLERSQLATIVR